MSNWSETSCVHVLVAGGGVAALETVLALRALIEGDAHITLLAPDAELLYRPVTVAEAFGRGEARSFHLDEILADQGVTHRHDALLSVSPAEHTVRTATGETIGYDALVVATGARRVDPLPGALVFGGRDDVPALRRLLSELTVGAARSVAFAISRPTMWPLPMYELALLTAAHVREHGSDARVRIVTPEEVPLALFGADAMRALEPMLSGLDIELRCSARPWALRPGLLVLEGGGSVVADRVVILPVLAGPAVEGLPADEHGFIPVDSHGRVRDIPDVYAAGDVTTFPLKQGGLAAQQADAVAQDIAARAGAPVTARPFSPVLRGLLITPGAPIYLRAEPQRLARRSSVAIDERRRRAFADVPAASMASDQALWWPPAKIAGRYLAPYLATARPRAATAGALADRRPVSGPPLDDGEFDDALELALLLADGDARWGDYRGALDALEAAEDLAGMLPPEYETKRRLWLAELSAAP